MKGAEVRAYLTTITDEALRAQVVKAVQPLLKGAPGGDFEL